MVSLAKVQSGAAAYIDEEFCRKLDGWRKWVFGAAASMMLSDVGSIVSKLRDNEIVKMMGVFDDHGDVDVERLYQHFKAEAQKGSISFSAPILGVVTMNESDVDKLYSYIMGATG